MFMKSTVEPWFNEVAGDRPNLFVKWRVCFIENLDITNYSVNTGQKINAEQINTSFNPYGKQTATF